MVLESPKQSERERTASDKEVADFFIKHIEKPCELDIGGGFIRNIREFYIREAERILPKFTDQDSINKLRTELDKYAPKVG